MSGNLVRHCFGVVGGRVQGYDGALRHSCRTAVRLDQVTRGPAVLTMLRMRVDDTHPAARARQIELLRAAGPARRFAVARSLTRTVGSLSRRALRRRHPGATEAELNRMFVELHYGADLARRLMGDR